MKANTVKTIVICAVGSTFEWYDFSVFGVLAPILSHIFFPEKNRTIALMLTFTIFATGFIMRPLGSIFFGHIGDKHGRKKAIVISMFLMTIATVGIGLLPSGIHADELVVILLGLRLLQGFAVSGEYSGLITFIAETVSPKHYYFWQSFNGLASLGGFLLGTAIGSVALSLPHENAWRLPFIVSLLLGIAGLYLRLKANETQVFSQMLKKNKPLPFPFKQIVLQYKKTILLLVLLVAVDTSGFYFVGVYYPSFLVHLGVSEAHYLHATTLGFLIILILTPAVGAITDRTNLITMLGIGMVSYMIIPIVTLYLINANHTLAFIGQLLLFIPVVLVDPIIIAAFPRLFPARVRYSGVAVSISLSVCLFGGTTPLVSTYLIHTTGANVAPAIYLACIAVVSFITLLIAKKALQHDQITF